MASLNEIKKTRLEKIENLKKAGMNPYQINKKRDYTLKEVNENFTNLSGVFSVVGRVMAVRGQGAILFVVLHDGTGEFQMVFKKDVLGDEKISLFADNIDMGDFVEITGEAFVTERGANSILVKDWDILTKSLAPLPEKWAGLQDVEEKYRKRYLDILSDRETSQRFQKRSEIVKYIRNFFDSRSFMEIETPILQSQAGGAMAKTFNTHHNDYDMDMVLRISLEIEHKMLMVAGFNKIYEIGKNFRNEGSDATHIQEFTMMEWYASYMTLEENMNLTEDLLRGLAKDVMQKSVFTVYDKDGNPIEVDFDKKWERVNFADLLKENANLDMFSATISDIQEKAKEFGMDEKEISKTGKANLLDFIYKKSSRNNIIHPTFVMNYPSDLKPLAEQNGDGTANMCQLIIAGAEITNQYQELVDPIHQRNLLEGQSKAKDAGDEEAMSINEEFLTAMEHGMPPMTGFGMGIDRLVAILTEQKNLRDTIFFPIMRPRGEE
ncbi:MAG: lysyl-tRNA synthetase, class [Patescibacteria group bacterium]|nr:lysyl-tRNA synthetase, class [Patescibacteria group bacterium]